MKTFIPGLINPHIKPKAPLLAAITRPYRRKASHDLRTACLKPSFQGLSSECVLYALCGQAEMRNWKLFDDDTQLDPHPAYLDAKKHDGYPNEPGTTLQAGLDAMIRVGYVSNVAAGSIRSLDTIDQVYRALHRYDAVVCAWNATEGFRNPGRDGWIKSGGAFIGGGHATMACYFDEADTLGNERGSIGCQDSYDLDHGDQGFWRLTDTEARRIFAGAIVFDFLAPQ